MAKRKEKRKKAQAAPVENWPLVYLITGLITVLPIAFNPWGYNLYAPTRAFILYTGVSLLFLTWLYFAVLAGQARLYYRRIDVVVLLFILALVLSTAFSVHLHSSLFGRFLRYEGLFAWLAYLTLFLLARQILTTRDSVEFLAGWLARGTLIIAGYAVLQHFGPDFIKWRQEFVTNRAFSTLGNPAYLGAYLALVLPFLTAMAIGVGRRRRRVFLLAVMVGLLALAFTLTRGAWVSVVVSAAIFAVYNRRRLAAQVTGRRLIIGLALLLLAGSVMIVGPLRPATGTYVNRISDAIAGKGSVTGRFLTWKQTLPLVAKHPLFGSGIDTLYLTFSSQITPEYERLVVRDTATDRAHNDFLQMASTTGMIGLIAYLATLVMIFSVGLSKLRSATDPFWRWSVFGALTGAFGYLVMLQTHFSTIDVSPIFWVLAGIALAAPPGHGLVYTIDFGRWPTLAQNRLKVAAVPVLVCLIVAWLSLRPVVADVYYRQAQEAQAGGIPMLAILDLRAAVALEPSNDFYLTELGEFYLAAAPQAKNPAFLDNAVVVLSRARDVSPLSSYNYLHLGKAYLARYEYSKKQADLDFAKAALKRGLALDPNYAALHLKMGLAYAYSRDYNRAKDEWIKVTRLAPKAVSAYYNLGRMLQEQGDTKGSRAFYRQALAIDPNQTQAKRGLETVLPGQLLWVERLGDRRETYRAPAIASDKEGNIYLVGLKAKTGAPGDTDFVTVKYNSAGRRLWTQRHNGPVSGGPRAVAIGPEGNLYVAVTGAGDGTGRDMFIAKRDAAGNQVWLSRYGRAGDADSVAAALKADDSGVYVIGYTPESGDKERQIAVMKYALSGERVWASERDGPEGDELPRSVASVTPGSDGSVYITGSRGSKESADMVTVKYDASGRLVWLRKYAGPSGGLDAGADLTVGEKGNLFVAGISRGRNGRLNYVLMKYDAAGRSQWVRRYQRASKEADGGPVVAFSKGQVLLAGYDWDTRAGNEAVAIEYNANGERLWTRRYNGNGKSDDRISAVTVGKKGFFYTAGTSASGNKSLDASLFTIKLAP